MNIILSAIKKAMRDKEYMCTVIFLAVLLPYLFSAIFYNVDFNDDKKETVNLIINVNESSDTIRNYEAILKDLDKENKNLTIAYKIKEELNFNEEDSYEMKIIIDEKNNEIKFLASNESNLYESMIVELTKSYFNQSFAYEFATQNGYELNTNKQNIIKHTNYFNEEKVKEVNNEEYFSIIMLQMAILVSSINAFKNISYIKGNIGKRIYSSPMPMRKLVLNEYIGSFAFSFIQGVTILGIGNILYKVNVNLSNVLGLVFMIVLLAFMAASIGIFVASLFESNMVGENVVSIIVVVMTIASGKMTPEFQSESIGGIFRINPFVWVSEAMINLVENNTYTGVFSAMVVTVVFSLILIIISTILMKKRKVVR
ncbi:MAG: ABC transporter permease [Romboutsia sp.]|uniref:ABC transporter permease n=1 Tax=Romboutsia sp. TaxID=1965302 RepID=UPI003F31D546